MASLTSCFRKYKVTKEDRDLVKKLVSDNKDAGVKNYLKVSIDEAIALAEQERTAVVGLIEKQGGKVPEYSPKVEVEPKADLELSEGQTSTENAEELGLMFLKMALGDHNSAIARLAGHNFVRGSIEAQSKSQAVDILEADKAARDTAAHQIRQKYPNGLALLEAVADSDAPGLTKQLAKYLLDTVSWEKLQEVDVGLASGMNQYDSFENKISLRATSAPSTHLHEVVHSVTVNEMKDNPALVAKVRKLMYHAKQAAVDSDLMPGMDQATADKLVRIETAKEFMDQGMNTVAGRSNYAFVNHKEFLSEAFGNVKFQEFLKTVPAVGEKTDKSLYQTLMRYVGEALGMKSDKKFSSMLEEVFTLTAEIANSDVVAEDTLFKGEPVADPEIDTASKKGKKKKVPKTRSEQTKIMLENDLRGKPVELAKEWFEKAKDVVRDVGKGATERLRKVDPRLVAYVRKMEFKINDTNMKYQKEIKGFVDGYRKLTKQDKLMLDLTLMNNKEEDVAIRKEILRRAGMTGAYNKVEKVLKAIHKEKGTVGLNNYKDVAEYFPRRVKDVRGLMQKIKDDPNYNVIQAQLDALGEDATVADKEKAIQQMVHTGRFPSLALLEPSSSKRRVIKRVSSEWKHFYENSADALVNHIYDSSESVQARKLFGDTHRRKLIAARDQLFIDLDNPMIKGQARKGKVSKLLAIENQLEDFETEFNNGINQFLAEKAPDLDTAQADEVIRVIRARLTQRGMKGAAASIRNVSLMSVLGSPTSAITQIGDLAFSLYKYGPSDTVKAMLGDKIITPKDLDLSHSMKEFQQEGTAKWLDRTLKWSGLAMMDTFGKNTTMNAALKNAKKMSLKEFKHKFGHIVTEGELDQMHKDIQGDKNTELTRFFAFNELSNFQPTNMSEMPLMYLQGGNGRIVYALKSYNIKAINNIYRESVYAWKTAKNPGDKAQAARNVGKLVLLMSIAGATADELKDLLLGKESKDFSDNVWDNFLKIGMQSRYTFNQGWGKGISQTIIKDLIIPPVGFIDDPLGDLHNLYKGDPSWKTVQNLPWGKLPYNWYSKTADDRNYRNLRQDVFDNVKGGASVSSVRKDMHKYNKWARKNDKTLITYNRLQQAKRKAKEA